MAGLLFQEFLLHVYNTASGTFLKCQISRKSKNPDTFSGIGIGTR